MYQSDLQRPATGSAFAREFDAAVRRKPVVASLFGAVALGAVFGLALRPTAADRPPAERQAVRKVVSQDAWPDELSIVVDSRLPRASPLPTTNPETGAPPAPIVQTRYRPEPAIAPPRLETPPEPVLEPAELELKPAGPPDDSCVFVGPNEVVCGEAARPPEDEEPVFR